MTLAKLLQESVLLKKLARLATVGIVENETRTSTDRDFVLVLEFSTLITANNGFVDIRSVA